MKFRLFVLLLAIALAAACKKVESDPPPVLRGTQVIQENEIGPTFPATQAVATYTATPEPAIAPSRTPRPINTNIPRPSWTPPATSTWWGLPPATPQNDVLPTPLPSPSLDQISVQVHTNEIVVFDPDRQAKWVEALSPLPHLEFPRSLDADVESDETMTVTLEFKPIQLVEINLDQDEALEVVLAYLLLPPRYSEETFTPSEYEAYNKFIQFNYGAVQIAVIDDGDDQLLGKSETVPLDFSTGIELSGVNLSANLKGVFLSLRGWGPAMYEGSATKILYIWQDSELQAAWHWEKEFISFASSQRYTHRIQVSDQTSFQDVDGDGFEEFLFAHSVYNLQNATGCCLLHYWLSYPGVLVYKWDDDGLHSVYLLVDGHLQPIRPQSPTNLAPYLDRPIVVDGDLMDWNQIEYVNYYHDLTYDECLLPGRIRFAWDNENLYVGLFLLPEEEIVLALDTDFETDFGSTSSDMDDVFLTVSVDDVGTLDLSLEAELNGNDPAIVSATGVPNDLNSYAYPVEISIPLERLGLDEIALTAQIGWGVVREYSSDANGYYPAMQAIAGFAVQSNQDNTWPTCFELNEAITMDTAVLDLNNPTTWGTLIFTADRGAPSN